MPDVKEPKTYEEQIAILRSHGCIIDDETDCKVKLSSIGYYRLSAYFLPFKQDDGTYANGTSFSTVFRIYEFDRKLRHLLFGAIDVIEIYLRSTLSYFHSTKYGSLGYRDAANFKSKHDHKKFEANLEVKYRTIAKSRLSNTISSITMANSLYGEPSSCCAHCIHPQTHGIQNSLTPWSLYLMSTRMPSISTTLLSLKTGKINYHDNPRSLSHGK